jgi:predicted DCC family thiol-disulfide oxidoreductase YuxK
VLHRLDVFRRVELVDFTVEENRQRLENFDFERAQTEMLLATEEGWTGGFRAFRKIALSLPLLWPLVAFLYLPPMTVIGDRFYKLIARNRYVLFGRCNDGYCEVHTGATKGGDPQ